MGDSELAIMSKFSSNTDQDMEDELCRFQPLQAAVLPLSTTTEMGVMTSPSHCPAPAVPVVPSAVSSVQVSPELVREVYSPGTPDVIPTYEPSPDASLYVPATSLVTPALSEGRVQLLGTKVEIDWDQPGEILSPGCPHHPCLSIPGTRRLPVLSLIKKYGWWNKNGCCHLYCGSGHFHNIKIIVNGSNMSPFNWN